MDSGAHISVISETFLATVPKKLVKHISPKFGKVTGVGGKSHRVTDRVVVSIHISGNCFEQDFHVLEGHHALILGIDFLTKHKAKLNFEAGEITLSGNRTFRLEQLTSRSSLARTVGSVCVPARSEMTFPVALTRAHNGDYLVTESVMSMELTNPELKVTTCVVKPTGTRTVCRVVNSADHAVTLIRGQIVAICYRVPPTYVMEMSESECDFTNSEAAQILVHDSKTESPLSNLTFEMTYSDLDENQKAQLNKILKNYRSTFAVNMKELGATHEHHHHIDTGSAKPVSQRFYRASPKIREEMERQIDELLEHGLIEPSTSEWRSPVVMIRKRDQTYRFAVDYRKLNAITRKMSFPLPRLEDIWDAIGEADAKYFTVLDMSSGFWQLPLHPDSKHKSSFVTQRGQYQWNRLPFGLSNSPISFQVAMTTVFQGLLFKSVLVYVDDIIVYSPTFEKHIEHLQEVFHRLSKNNLTLKPSKCHFAVQQVEYLGHIISKDGVKPNPSKTDVIETYPSPSDKTQLRRFLGMANYYKRFIQSYSQLTSPLNKLLKNDTSWEWTDDCSKSFQAIKHKLVNAPILAYPDTDKEFTLTTDASGVAIGYILSQRDNEQREQVIAYGGRALRKAERNYPVRELEGLAIIEGIKSYHPYLANSHFTVVTDHMALKYLMNVKADTGRIARWALALQGYDFTVVHRKGLVNRNADALSRRAYEQEGEVEIVPETPPYTELLTIGKDEINTERLLETTFLYHDNQMKENMDKDRCITHARVTVASLIDTSIAEIQQTCPDIGPMYNYIAHGDLPKEDKLARKVILEADQYGMREQVLYHVFSPRTKGTLQLDKVINQVVVPKCLRSQILSEYHDSLIGGGHQGFDRTYCAIKMKYYWSGMYADVNKYVKTCNECQHAKRHYHSHPAPLHPLPTAGVFDRWHMDFLGPLKTAKGGQQYILLVVDSFSRWCEAFALKDQTAATVAWVLYSEIFTRYGAPCSLISDRGAQFMSKLVAALCELFAVKRHSKSPYHPQSNATCERMNSYIGQALRAYVKDDQSDWPHVLPGILMAYRMTPAMRSTEFSPYRLVFGREMVTAVDTDLIPKSTLPRSFQEHLSNIVNNLRLSQAVAAENVERNIAKNKTAHDTKARDPTFEKGQTVLLHSPHVPKGMSSKLHRSWGGPYYIVDCGPNHTFQLRHCVTHKPLKSLVHANRLKTYNDPQDRNYAQVEGAQEDVTVSDDLFQLPGNTDLNQDGQQGPVGTSDTQVTSDMSQPVSTDQEVKDQPQPVIERVLCARRKRWYKVKWLDVSKTEWVTEDHVPSSVQRDYFLSHTMTGRTKRKRPSQVPKFFQK